MKHARKWYVYLFCSVLWGIGACAQLPTSHPDAGAIVSHQAEQPLDSDIAYDFTVPESLEGVRSGSFSLDKTHASLRASLSHWGLSHYQFHFTAFDARFVYDAENPENSTIVLTVDLSGLETFFPDANKRGNWHDKLRFDPKFFDAKKHPLAFFRSRRIQQTGPQTAIVSGVLGFRGIENPAKAEITFNGARAFPWDLGVKRLGFDADLRFKRSDFGLTALLPNIGDDVQVSFTGEFRRD